MKTPFDPMLLAKDRCVGCGSRGKMTREHFWPQWLIERTNTVATGVKWADGKKVNPKSATLPLCKSCNEAFGRELEAPARAIFDDLESGIGLSDYEAELLIRWLWKFEGLAWLMTHPMGNYSNGYLLRDRVLRRLSGIREHLSLAVAMVHKVDPRYGDSPLGICSHNERNAIYVSAVFSRVALMSLFSDARQLVPAQFSVYRLLPTPDAPESRAKLFHPRMTFADDTEAIVVTRLASPALEGYHETLAVKS